MVVWCSITLFLKSGIQGGVAKGFEVKPLKGLKVSGQTRQYEAGLKDYERKLAELIPADRLKQVRFIRGSLYMSQELTP